MFVFFASYDHFQVNALCRALLWMSLCIKLFLCSGLYSSDRFSVNLQLLDQRALPFFKFMVHVGGYLEQEIVKPLGQECFKQNP